MVICLSFEEFRWGVKNGVHLVPGSYWQNNEESNPTRSILLYHKQTD